MKKRKNKRKNKSVLMTRNNFNMYNDILFKSFFQSIEARPMVSSFLSAVTHIKKEKFMNAQFVGGIELPLKNVKEKKKTSDIIVKLDNNNRIIVEMNQFDSYNIFEKNTKYAFNLITKTNESSSKKESKVLLINIDLFNKYKSKRPILNFKIRDEEGHIENELYHSIHIIVENCFSKNYNIDKEIKKFINFLNQTSLDDMKNNFEGDEDYMAGYVKVEDLLQNVDEVGLLYDYEAEMKDRYNGWVKQAKINAKKEGRELGIKEGRKEGIKEGRKEGIKEGIEQKTKETAIELHKNGAPDEMIMKSLGITKNQLNKYLNI